MAKKPEKPVYAFIRRGRTLVPEMDMDMRAIEHIAQGARVRIEVKEFRNFARHRAYWAMIHDVIEATDCALTPERLHEVVKLETGLVDLIALPNGMKVAIPGSISFDKCDESEFQAFFRAAEMWLAETYGYVNTYHNSGGSSSRAAPDQTGRAVPSSRALPVAHSERI